MLNLDIILAEPFEVQIGDEVYKIEDPGVESIMKMISLAGKINKQSDLLPEFMDHLRFMTQSIPEKIFKNLNSKQLTTLMHEMGKYFLSQDDEGKPKGPLPDCE